MPATINCTNCGVALNLPPQALGRRLKCPKCGVKFHAAEPTNLTAAAMSKPSGSGRGPDLSDLDRPSTLELRRSFSSKSNVPDMPNSPGDLRDTFTLPMMTEEDLGSPIGLVPDSTADASALFKEDSKPRKRPTGAEGRAQARRCTTCGGVVPIGMSICQRCGLDLDTGSRVDLLEDIGPPPPPPQTGIPILIGVIGGLCLAASAALGLFALILTFGGNAGTIYFVPIALFGGYAAVQFLRRKSIKLLLVALSLGAAIDLVVMVAVPIWNANQDIQVSTTEDTTENPDSAGEVISSPLDQLDTNRVTTGFALLGIYAAVSVLLLSATVNKQFRR